MNRETTDAPYTLRAVTLALILAFGGSTLLAGCDDQGPAEEAGESIDEAAEDAGDAIDDATS